MNYSEIFIKNYEGKTPEANEVKDFLKDTYSGFAYIPWATIERLARMQDPEFTIEPILTNEGGLIHTDNYHFKQLQNNKGDIIETVSSAPSHTIWLTAKFMGVIMNEYYPILDSTNEPVKFPTQRDMNNALQRGKAKLISRLTGIGLKLYESKDLQFEDVSSKDKIKVKANEVVQKVQQNIEKPSVVVEQKVEQKVEQAVDTNLANLFVEKLVNKDKVKLLEVLKPFNTALIKSFNVSIAESDFTDPITLQEKLEKIPNASDLITTLEGRL